AVAHETASLNISPSPKHAGKPVLQCEVGQGEAVRLAQRGSHNKKTVDSLSYHRLESSVEVLAGLRGHLKQLNPKLSSGDFDGLYRRRMRGCRRVPENADPLRLRHRFCQNLQFFGGNVGENHRQTRNVPAGLREARHVPDAHRVGVVGEYDRDRLVACRAGSTKVEEFAKMTSTFIRTSSAASSGN